MNTLAKLTASAAIVLLSSSMALAECLDADTTASTTEATKTPPMQKDGGTAPLEMEPDATSDQAQAEPTQKDGGNMPLSAAEEDRSDEDLATSQQDVEAQQEGEQTAAAEADAC